MHRLTDELEFHGAFSNCRYVTANINSVRALIFDKLQPLFSSIKLNELAYRSGKPVALTAFASWYIITRRGRTAPQGGTQ
jgi:hypothetical protein